MAPRYQVDFLFLPDRDGGVRVEVTASDETAAVEAATRQLTREIPAVWSFEVESVQVL